MPGTMAGITRTTAAALLLLCGGFTQVAAQHDSLAPPKSPGTALLLSLGATVVPYAIATGSAPDQNSAIAVLAIFVGPAVGHFYAGNWRRGFTGIGIRGVIILATGALLQDSCHDSSNPNEWLCITPAFVLAGTAFLVSMIVDITAAPGSARKYNVEHPRLTIVPLPDGPRSRLGIGIQMRR